MQAQGMNAKEKREVLDEHERTIRKKTDLLAVEEILKAGSEQDKFKQFVKNQNLLENDSYWKMLGLFWRTIGRTLGGDIWLDLFNSERGHKDAMMSSKERSAWRLLPKTMWLWRLKIDEPLLSFYPRKNIAEDLALKNGIAEIERYEVPKKKIVAVLDRKTMREIIASGVDISELVETVSVEKPTIEKVMDL